MKFFAVLVSLFAAAQAQFAITVPTPGTTIQAGQAMTIQITVPVDTSAEAGQEEVSLVLGLVACGASGCPPASADLGELLFIGKYQSQGEIGNLTTFENFTGTFAAPVDIIGSAAIQAQHVFLTTLPGEHTTPTVEYHSVPVQVAS